MSEEYFDAHIGISPSQSVHALPYISAICSSCMEAINFKITQKEFDKLKKQLHDTTKSKKEEVKISHGSKANGIMATKPMTWEELQESYDKGEIHIITVPKKVLKKQSNE